MGTFTFPASTRVPQSNLRLRTNLTADEGEWEHRKHCRRSLELWTSGNGSWCLHHTTVSRREFPMVQQLESKVQLSASARKGLVLLVKTKSISVVASCTPDPTRWPYPAKDIATGLLKRVLTTGELKVAGVIWIAPEPQTKLRWQVSNNQLPPPPKVR